jgi:hypothetical protein
MSMIVDKKAELRLVEVTEETITISMLVSCCAIHHFQISLEVFLAKSDF